MNSETITQKDIVVLEEYAQILSLQGKSIEAQAQYEKALEIDPSCVVRDFAKFLFKQGRYNEAQLQWEDALKLRNHYHYYSHLLGYAETLIELGKYNEAIIQWGKILIVDPKNARALKGYSDYLIRRKSLPHQK
jgi:tetratricopeptide (TPR) repeat protein